MEIVAQTVGYVVMGVVGLGVLVVLGFLAWAYFPAQWTFFRRPNARTGGQPFPLVDWRNQSGRYDHISLLIGPSARGKTRWFFGLVLFTDGGWKHEYQWPKVIRSDTTFPRPSPQGEKEP